MAVQLEFINIIIKRESIDRIVSGGWEGFLQQMELKQFNDCFDDHLFRTGAMSYEEAFDIAHELNDIGLSGLASGDKPQKYWVDFCIFDSTLGTEYRVDWLDLDYHRAYSYAIRLAGDASAVVHSPDTSYSPFRKNDLEPIHLHRATSFVKAQMGRVWSTKLKRSAFILESITRSKGSMVCRLATMIQAHSFPVACISDK